MNAVPADRLIDRAACGHRARAHRQILPSDLAGHERCDQRGVRFGRARHHEEPARILVEPVHEPRARHPRQLRIEREQRVRKGMPGITRPGMHDEPGRLVDDDERAVLMNHLERNRLGADWGLSRQLGLDAHLFAALHLVPGPRRSPLDLHRSRFDPALEERARILRQSASERPIEAQPRVRPRQSERMRAELRRRFRGRKRTRWIRYTPRTQSARSQRKALPRMLSPGPVSGSVVALCVALVALGGCRTHRASDEKKITPEVLYKRARHDLDAYDFYAAIKYYEQLMDRTPMIVHATTTTLDLIYPYYRAGEGESATDAAETFIRENPTHPRVDYAYYIRGLVDFERTPNLIEHLFRADLTQRPPSTARKAFAAFRKVVEQYPKSEYAHDSLQRMVYLRNRLASYEVHVARYYFKRGAYVAAAQRAKGPIEQYDGAPAEREALEIMIESYDRLNLQRPAAEARQVCELNCGTDLPRAA